MARPRGVRRILTLLRPHARGEMRSLGAGALLGLGIVTLQLLRPWPLKWILDYISGTSSPVGAWVAQAPGRGIAVLSLTFLGAALAGAGAEYIQSLLLNGAGNRILFRFRSTLFGQMLQQPLSFHQSREIGELLTRVVYDTSRLRRGLNGLLLKIFQSLALFASTFLVVIWVDPLLGSILAAGGILALLSMRRRGRRIARGARKQRIREGRLAGLVANELKAIRELQTFGVAASGVQQRFSGRNNRSLRQEQKVRRLSAGLSLQVELLLALSLTIALWIGTQAVTTGRLHPGELVLFFSYALALRGPMVDFAYQTARLGRTYACADRLARIAGRPTAIADHAGSVPAPPFSGVLGFEDVALKAAKRRRGGRKWTLDGLQAALPAGKRIAVIGPNGAGKSTLLSLVLRLTDPNRGRVLLDHRDLRDYTLDTLRGQMSVVFQDSVLNGLTVWDNIALGVPDASDEAVRRAAEAARADAFIERLPLGYATPVRRAGELFSGGERQRLAIARALLRNGRIWLLDEPTTGLDPATASSITELLLKATSGRTTLWVTHDPELVARMDWVLALDRGAAVFNGSPEVYQAWCSPRTKWASNR